jgi:hypothetical protein
VGELSSLSGHAKPWASVDVCPASSQSRRLFGIELEGGGSYDSNAMFELPGSGAAKHVSRTHDFALALPDPDAPSDDGDECGLDLDRTSPAYPSPALLLPAAVPVRSGARDVQLSAAATSRFVTPPLHTNKRLPPTPSSPAAAEAPRPDLDRRRRSSASVSGAPPSSEYADDGDEAEARGRWRRTSAHGLSVSPARSGCDAVLDDLDPAGEAAESATIHRRRGDESHMTFLADESDEEASAGRRSEEGDAAAVELLRVEPAHVKRERGGAAFDRWRT